MLGNTGEVSSLPSPDPDEPPRRPRGLLYKLGVTLAAFVVGLCGCEFGVRLLGLAPPPHPEARGNLFQPSSDPIQRFENRPGGSQRILYRDAPGERARVVWMAVNSQGFRGPTVSRKKPAETFRIACVGDSHTFGHGVAACDTWPAELSAILGARFPDRNIEVINCGVENYDTMQEYIWLRDKVLDFSPDLVVMQFFVNDARAQDLPREPVRRDWIIRLSHPSRDGLVRRLRDASRLADLVLDGVWRRHGLAIFSDLHSEFYREPRAEWLRVQSALRSTRDELAGRGIGYGLALYPFLVRSGEHLTSYECFEVVKAFCVEEGIRVLDAEPAFLASDVDSLRNSPHDFHGNPEANRIFATAVADWLVAEGLLTSG
ncbi:MAG: hypothetical protein E2O39_03435 [Planctomycetota bacterium]|nr:MAG: hypothetical protein E2O39_03435 [Planctomycetota bacterium]